MKQVVTATEFKAKCLAILDGIQQTGEKVTVTRRGTPIAVVGPVKQTRWRNPADSCAHLGSIEGDIISPLDGWFSGKEQA